MNTVIQKITIFPGVNKLGEQEKFDPISIVAGKPTAIVGNTGAGKSQLLYDIERLAQRDTKTKRLLLINDQKPNREIRFDPKRKLIASLSQNMHFLTDISVRDFLTLHLKSRGKTFSSEVLDKVIQSANKITGEAISYTMNLLDLSGGQSRALMIADMAIISDSPILLIDELENAGIKKNNALELLMRENKIILLVTHDPALALQSHKRLIIKNGGIVDILYTTLKEKEIAQSLNLIEEAYLGIKDKIRLGYEIKHTYIDCKKQIQNGSSK